MKFFSVVALSLLLANSSFAVKNDVAAPDFTGTTSEGKTIKLSDYKGKNVVLEWTNHGCPFVKKHYKSGNMQSLQKEFTAKGVVWLSVISSAAGKEGNVTPAVAEREKKDFKAVPSAIILDSKGEIGKLYGAETTPHMFVIDTKGVLVYQGAIDDKPSTDLEDIKPAKNYVRAALESTIAGKKIEMAQTKSYGCSVKY